MTSDDLKEEVDAVIKEEPISSDDEGSRNGKDALKHNLKASTSAAVDKIAETTEGLSKSVKKNQKRQRRKERQERARLLAKNDSDDSSTARSSPSKSKISAQLDP